ncbi:LOW QUALITY PROTEIN: GTPase IMAP family member 8-like [Periophthalmus magnuspinnatus]|uniref:LOW QUALITY PROTEIN: GTPase IMAP family member 8-like n=1 Tax=Periophthalmus magnuspinnatus TaxID=409849 RepID=UPI0024369E09|nr:LOW QUALITY PROTEIN: GTPase IMAP family member 8-like [Periophthalmus magnuspinnatus]
MEQNEPMRIVLLGKTGAGKSSLANVIFGEEGKFKESDSPNSEKKMSCINRRVFRLIDTPGLFDTDLNDPEMSPEILKCIEECAPGPHAFLLVLRVERYTRQEQEVVEKILKHFSEEALKYTTVVFTHGDQLKQRENIKDWAKQNEALRSLVQKCGGRCHVFDCKYWKNSQDPYRNNQLQVTELLRTIQTNVEEKNWRHYTNMFLEFVINNMERIRFFFKFAAKVLLGALLGEESSAEALLENRAVTEEESDLCPEAETLRIVLLGKSGSGKSSVANTIMGEELFMLSSNISKSITRRVHGRNITLIDTPGVLDMDLRDTELSPDFQKCMHKCDPGPHAFVLVLRVERFTRQEQIVVNLILKYFSEEALKYTTVVFTHGDQLNKGMEIKKWVEQNEALRSLVQKCGGRCHVFDNKYWNNSQDPYRNNQLQVKALLRTIQTNVEENGGYYSNENLQKIQNQIKPKSFFSWIFEEETRIILLGKTGSGKSSLGNTIFGEEIFKVKSSPNSETSVYKPHRKVIDGRSICLIDTPGVFDTNPDKADLSEMFYQCVQDCAPGPHAFVLVLRVERYTPQEQSVVRQILQYFSEEVLKYTTVVFTHGDDLNKGENIKDWANQNEALRSLVQKCGGRCHVIDNKYWNNSQDPYRNNQLQVKALLRTIQTNVEENRGRCYSNGFWKHIKYMRVKGVPLRYLLIALLGAATGVGAAVVAKVVFGASTAAALGVGVAGCSVGAAAGACALAPEED